MQNRVSASALSCAMTNQVLCLYWVVAKILGRGGLVPPGLATKGVSRAGFEPVAWGPSAGTLSTEWGDPTVLR